MATPPKSYKQPPPEIVRMFERVFGVSHCHECGAPIVRNEPDCPLTRRLRRRR